MQNIPSHNQEVRLLFRATDGIDNSDIINDEYYELDKWAKVETINGWKSVYNLELNDILIGDETKEQILDISIMNNRAYRIYTNKIFNNF